VKKPGGKRKSKKEAPVKARGQKAARGGKQAQCHTINLVTPPAGKIPCRDSRTGDSSTLQCVAQGGFRNMRR